MGELFNANGKAIAVFDNCKIYTAKIGFMETIEKGDLIGEYHGSKVYRKNYKTLVADNLSLVATCSKGEICAVNSNFFTGQKVSLPMGYCVHGKVYDSSSHECLGEYYGDDEGAAAAVALVLFGLTSDVSGEIVKEANREKIGSQERKSGREFGLGSAMVWIIGIVVAIIVFVFSIAAALMAGSITLGVWLLYIIAKFIMKQAGNPMDNSEYAKHRDLSVVMIISMLISLGVTTYAMGTKALIPLVLELIVFPLVIVAVWPKKGMSKVNPDTTTETKKDNGSEDSNKSFKINAQICDKTNIDTCTDDFVDDEATEITTHDASENVDNDIRKNIKPLAIMVLCALGAVILFSCLSTFNNDDGYEVYDESEVAGDVNSSENSVGKIVIFGSYEQDGNSENGPEPIEWLVIDENANGKMLISDKILDARYFDDLSITNGWTEEDYSSNKQVWKDSNIREWLNGDFLRDAFTTNERTKIIETQLTTQKEYGGNTYIDTSDKVFLLSADEAQKFFGTIDQMYVEATEYAIKNSVYNSPPDYDNIRVLEKFPNWQLRSGGKEGEYYAALVVSGDDIYPEGNCIVGAKHGIRPVIWVSEDIAYSADMSEYYLGDYQFSNERTAVAGGYYSTHFLEFDAILNCREFMIEFGISQTDNQDVYNTDWSVYARKTDGDIEKVGSLYYSKKHTGDNTIIQKIITLSEPMDITGLAIVPEKELTANWNYYLDIKCVFVEN